MDAFIRVIYKWSAVVIGGRDASDEIPNILKTTMFRIGHWQTPCNGNQLTAQIAADCVRFLGERAEIQQSVSMGGARHAWVVMVDCDAQEIRFRSSQFVYSFGEYARLDLSFLFPGFNWGEGIIDALTINYETRHPYYRERIHRIKRMLESGQSIDDISNVLGISQDVVRSEIKDHLIRSKRL